MCIFSLVGALRFEVHFEELEFTKLTFMLLCAEPLLGTFHVSDLNKILCENLKIKRLHYYCYSLTFVCLFVGFVQSLVFSSKFEAFIVQLFKHFHNIKLIDKVQNTNFQSVLVGRGPPGDLFVYLDVQEIPEIQRDGINLLSTVSISYIDAILGAAVQVEILSGHC